MTDNPASTATLPTGKPPRRQSRFSWPLAIITSLVLLSLAFALDAGYGLITLRRHLLGVADSLDGLDARLAKGDIEGARTQTEEARTESEDAADALNRPSLFLASLVPGVDQDTGAIESAVEAAYFSARAATSIVETAAGLDLDSEGIPTTVYVDGQVDLDKVADAREKVNEAELLLEAAVVTLESTDARFAQLRNSIREAHSRTVSALDRVTRGRSMFDLIHGLLGGKGRRTYLLALQAPGEARATGGLVGQVGVLEASKGRLSLKALGPGAAFFRPRSSGITAPAWFRDSYSAQKALTQWQQANTSPNFPVVSEVLLEMFEEGRGARLDGVIAMDPLALADMMAGMDAIQTSNPPLTVDASNVAEVLLRNSYVEIPTETGQDVFLKEIVDGFWNKVSEGDVDLRPFAEGLSTALRTQHVKIFSRHGEDQKLLEDLDLDGNYDTRGSSAQMAFNINYALNKVDYFLQRHVSTEIRLQPDGTAVVNTTMQMKNGAPTGPVSILLGQGDELPVGTNRMMVNLLMPPGSIVGSMNVGPQQSGPFTYTDENSPVVWDVISIAPGGQETVSVTYQIPAAIQVFGDDTVFDFVLFPQPTVNPDTYSLRIQPPPGVQVVNTQGMTADGVLSMNGTLEEPVVVRMQMEPE